MCLPREDGKTSALAPDGMSWRAVSEGCGLKCTNNVGELRAIELAIDWCLDAHEKGYSTTNVPFSVSTVRSTNAVASAALSQAQTQTQQSSEQQAKLQQRPLIKGAAIEILTDSHYSQGVLTLGHAVNANVELVARIKAKLARLRGVARSVRLPWVKGHHKLAGNEAADNLARFAIMNNDPWSEQPAQEEDKQPQRQSHSQQEKQTDEQRQAQAAATAKAAAGAVANATAATNAATSANSAPTKSRNAKRKAAATASAE